MKCQQCKRQESLKIHRRVCRYCLAKLVEKAVKRSLGIRDIITKNQKVVLVDDGSAASRLLKRVVDKVLEPYPVKIKTVKAKTQKKPLTKLKKPMTK